MPTTMPERNRSTAPDAAGLDRGLDGVAGLGLAADLRIALTPSRAAVRAIAPKARMKERWTDRLTSGPSERRAISATAASSRASSAEIHASCRPAPIRAAVHDRNAKNRMGWAHQGTPAP